MKEQKKENRIGLIFPKIYSISQEKRRDRQTETETETDTDKERDGERGKRGARFFQKEK